MPQSDDACSVLGIPDYLHTLAQTSNQEFNATELLYRRHQLNDRKIKTIINFREMSVNRSSCCRSPSDVLTNTQTGDEYLGFGVVSFSVGAIRGLFHNVMASGQQIISYGASVIHEPERCNYSHTIVVGSINQSNIPKNEDLPKITRKILRQQLWGSISTEIPIELKRKSLEEESW